MAEELNKPEEGIVKRQKVDIQWHRLNWEFLRLLAEIAEYADHKYGETENYANGRAEKDKSPLNHIVEHYTQYITRKPYEHFDSSIKYHLGAIAYNAMMEFYQLQNGGPTVSDKLYKPM